MDSHRKTAPAHLQMSLVGHGRAITMVLLLEFVRQAATASHETPHDSMRVSSCFERDCCVVGAEVKEGEHGAGGRGRRRSRNEPTWRQVSAWGTGPSLPYNNGKGTYLLSEYKCRVYLLFTYILSQHTQTRSRERGGERKRASTWRRFLSERLQ